MTPAHSRVIVLLCAPGHDFSSDHEQRDFVRALKELETVIPNLEAPRLGVCVTRARGPARFYGSEVLAAQALLEGAVQQGYSAACVGIADSRFVAEQVVRAALGSPGVNEPFPGVRVVLHGNTPAFLEALPLSTTAPRYEEIIGVLAQLGIHTCGALAALSVEAITQRFGALGADLHRLARGHEPQHLTHAHTLPYAELSRSFSLDSPLDDAERLAFASSADATAFIQDLAAQGLVCTELSIELIDDAHTSHARTWAQPSHFTDFDIVNRVRWQAATVSVHTERHEAGIVEVVFTTSRVARAADHEPGLWSTAPNQRIHHHLARIQHLVGLHGVCTAELTGGRLSADRQRFLPWGHRTLEHTPASAGPWPGHLTGPPPSMVFAQSPPIALLDQHRSPVRITSDQALTADPLFLDLSLSSPDSMGFHEHQPLGLRRIRAWSALWPLRERWWSDSARTSYRLQVIEDAGDAWLLRHEQPPPPAPGFWVAEGRYD